MQAVPILASIGGGSAATGAVLLGSAALTVGAGVASARQSRAAGRIAEAQANIDANAEGDAAREREIQRKRLLMRAISSQSARAAAGGVALEGSPARIAALDIDEANRDLLVDRANSLQRQKSLRAAGRAARTQGSNQGMVTLLDTAGRSLSSFSR